MVRSKNNNKKSAFLFKTYDMLQNPTFSQIIEWHFDGIGFMINNIDLFANKILPIYFKHSNFASFIRQLNMYGFSKKRTINNQNYYYHPKFKRNQKDLIYEIKRKIQKKVYKSSMNSSKIKQSGEEVKINSELSIQLQSKPDLPKKIENEFSEQKLQSELQMLEAVNAKLINTQFQVLIEFFKDLNSIKNNIIPEQNIMSMKNVLKEYIEAQYTFHNQLKERTNSLLNSQQKNTLSTSKLLTQQTLRSKKQSQQNIQENTINNI